MFKVIDVAVCSSRGSCMENRFRDTSEMCFSVRMINSVLSGRNQPEHNTAKFYFLLFSPFPSFITACPILISFTCDCIPRVSHSVGSCRCIYCTVLPFVRSFAWTSCFFRPLAPHFVDSHSGLVFAFLVVDQLIKASSALICVLSNTIVTGQPTERHFPLMAFTVIPRSFNSILLCCPLLLLLGMI